MIRAGQIPDEVECAFRKAWMDGTLTAKGALAAALAAWPGSCNVACTLADLLLLPLPQEPRDE